MRTHTQAEPHTAGEVFKRMMAMKQLTQHGDDLMFARAHLSYCMVPQVLPACGLFESSSSPQEWVKGIHNIARMMPWLDAHNAARIRHSFHRAMGLPALAHTLQWCFDCAVLCARHPKLI